LSTNDSAASLPVRYDVQDFGARLDGLTLDTVAVQDAIDLCHVQGGGAVYFPPNSRCLIGTIYLRSCVTLHIGASAAILGSTRIADYAMDTGHCPYYPEPLDRCLIFAKDAHHIALTGQGVIDGQFRGELFEQLPGAQGRGAVQRPMLLRFENCENVEVSGLTLEGSCAWCTHIARSRNVRLNRLNVFNDMQDGFNIESCEDVLISDCNLRCGDDGIALTTNPTGRPLRNLAVSNCLISSRWAAVRLGPLSKGDFENINVSNCIFRHCYGGGIKLGMFEGATIQHCLFSNIIMEDVTAPILILLARWQDIGSHSEAPAIMPVGQVRDIGFHNITAWARTGPGDTWYSAEQVRAWQAQDEGFLAVPDWSPLLFLQGYPGHELENIRLSGISMRLPGGGSAAEAARRDMPDTDQAGTSGLWLDHSRFWGVMPAGALFARHVRGLALNNVRVDTETPDERAVFFCMESRELDLEGLRTNGCAGAQAVLTLRDCQNVFVHGSRTLAQAEAFFRLEGAGCAAIVAAGNDLGGAREALCLADGASASAARLQGN
jgi:hypothetical protein